jgi:hypothetical protein
MRDSLSPQGERNRRQAQPGGRWHGDRKWSEQHRVRFAGRRYCVGGYLAGGIDRDGFGDRVARGVAEQVVQVEHGAGDIHETVRGIRTDF